ncbi:molybdate ABC transporter substrate-binding protein [Ferrimonas marina]|uniref:Molybdate transport system substrate-binding protein n=1 Tax=Ferrimonas marina TaxID=299255 RepID=A0A1M5XVE3_9GAMM|nr:molybdate ABC transporter substrate-binding protein [Ferrimonas marina]SHI03504.1 molybdate transport system substrate-binding protein [Ferrimonas marina]
MIRVLFFLAMLCTGSAVAAPLQVAVASNFKTTLELLLPQFEAETGVQVRISSGATGALYTQIIHGAPYDLFLAADDERPGMLVEQGMGQADSLQSYAVGVLAFWDPKGEPGEQQLRQWDQRLAVANPRTAPFGAAAEQVLERLELTRPLRGKVVRGSNILHTFQYVQSGNVPAGLVSLAQLKQADIPADQYWPVPADWHGSLVQQGVVLSQSKMPEQAQALLQYIAKQHTVLAKAGYLVPHDH